MKARFRVLRLVALVSKGLGWLCLIAGLALGALIANGTRYFPLIPPAQPYSANNLAAALTTFLPLFVSFLFFYGVGGALQVLMAIEMNTRRVPYEPPENQSGRTGEPGAEG